jgi:hypothetical protein
MSKILGDARMTSLKDKLEAIAPEDTADAVVKKVKKEDKKLKTKVGKLGVKSKKTK